MAGGRTVTVESKIDEKIFTRFALYDTFIMRKRWRRPLVFFLIMLCFSVICFVLKNRLEQSSLLAFVLLGVGIIVPLAYILMFILSAKDQAAKMHLSPAVAQYTVECSGNGIKVRNVKEEASFQWKQIYCAILRRDCIYLYVTPKNAYLLPYCDEAVKAWELIRENMPKRIIEPAEAAKLSKASKA